MTPAPEGEDEASEALPAAPRPPPPPPLTSAEEEVVLRAFADGTVAWDDTEGLWSLEVPAEAWLGACLLVQDRLLHPLASLFGEDRSSSSGSIRLHALFLGGRTSSGVHVRADLLAIGPVTRSLWERIPWVVPFERETAEMFGIEFLELPDRRPLLLHELHPRPPMTRGPASAPTGERAPYPFRPVEGGSVYEIPVGPVHAGIIEPGHFRFQVLGERILNLELRLGYTHKGTERLFEGRAPGPATLLAESVSGDMSVAGAVAFSHAIERALDIPISPGAEASRGLLLELERVAFLLGDVAGIALDTGYAAGAAQANVLRERAYEALGNLTGSRLARAVVSPGGLRRPLRTEALPGIGATVARTSEALTVLHERLLDNSAVEDRLLGTGVISRAMAEALNLVGPVARASGVDRDLRRDRPYGAYRDHPVRTTLGEKGDVAARLQVKVEEVREGCRLAGVFLEGLGAEPTVAPREPVPRLREAAHGLGWVESPRGEFLVWVALDAQGTLSRVHVRDPSFLNWPAIERAVQGNIVPDFPLCNKSLNLSYSGYDR
ncbi:MAG: NADH-quinone oxidoreductase subunit C [Thermoplasmata archaeon]|nr:NADH-quinone oxidoreductase subunit C [Thermoplasmata archaeon]